MNTDYAIFRSLVEHSVDTLFHITPDLRVAYVSPAVRRLLGFAPEELIGVPVMEMACEADRALTSAAAAKAVELSGENSPVTARWTHKAGHLVWIEVNGCMIQGADAQLAGFTIVLRDVSDRKALEEQLEFLATTDALTGLVNRRGFDEALDREWKRTMRTGLPTSLLLLDLDHFKWLNDSYGHAVGDDCLRAAAKAFAEAVRRDTDVVARYGGEEMAAILPYTDQEGAILVAEGVCRAVAALKIPHRENKQGGGVMTASIGVATALSRDGASHQAPSSLLQAADAALYKAKHRGRNRVEVGILLAHAA